MVLRGRRIVPDRADSAERLKGIFSLSTVQDGGGAVAVAVGAVGQAEVVLGCVGAGVLLWSSLAQQFRHRFRHPLAVLLQFHGFIAEVLNQYIGHGDPYHNLMLMKLSVRWIQPLFAVPIHIL